MSTITSSLLLKTKERQITSTQEITNLVLRKIVSDVRIMMTLTVTSHVIVNYSVDMRRVMRAVQ